MGLVLAAELRVQQPLFRTYARNERRDKKRREQHADSGMKGERPPQRIDEQTQIARVADDTIETSRDQRMPGLDGHQPAEPVAEHKDRPDSQRTAGGEENDAKPANCIPIESPELLPVCVGLQIGVEQTDQPEGTDYPAVGTIIAHAGAEVSATENSNARKHEKGA